MGLSIWNAAILNWDVLLVQMKHWILKTKYKENMKFVINNFYMGYVEMIIFLMYWVQWDSIIISLISFYLFNVAMKKI